MEQSDPQPRRYRLRSDRSRHLGLRLEIDATKSRRTRWLFYTVKVLHGISPVNHRRRCSTESFDRAFDDFRKKHGEKVALLTHSMGSNYIMFFLRWVTEQAGDQWIDEK